jgi:hypothetical protein
MPMITSKMSDDGIEWQLWRSARADDLLGPMYLVKKYPSGQKKLSAWGLPAASATPAELSHCLECGTRDTHRHILGD